MKDSELWELISECCDDIFNKLEPVANVKNRLYVEIYKELFKK